MRAFVDDKPYIEYLGGRPVAKVSPKLRHSRVQGALLGILRRLGDTRGPVGVEWRFRLSEARRGKTHLLPDVAFVSYERWRPLDERQREEPPFAPDVAVEVRSPGDRIANVRWKMRAYLEGGAKIALDVLPDKRRIIAYAHDGILEFGEGDFFEHPSIPWLRFDVREAFADLDYT